MFNPKLFNAGVIAASVLIGLSVPSAARASTTEKLHPIFDVSKLDAQHQELVAETLGDFDYDWNQLRPGLREIGKKRITIEIKDITTKWQAVGLSWPGGKLQIDDVVTDDSWFQGILRHEVGHMVDFFHLGPKQLHDEVSDIYGAPWSEMGHNFNNGFVEVFSSIPATDSSYPMTAAELQELRLLLGGTPKLPIKV